MGFHSIRLTPVFNICLYSAEELTVTTQISAGDEEKNLIFFETRLLYRLGFRLDQQDRLDICTDCEGIISIRTWGFLYMSIVLNPFLLVMICWTLHLKGLRSVGKPLSDSIQLS